VGVKLNFVVLALDSASFTGQLAGPTSQAPGQAEPRSPLFDAHTPLLGESFSFASSCELRAQPAVRDDDLEQRSKRHRRDAAADVKIRASRALAPEPVALIGGIDAAVAPIAMVSAAVAAAVLQEAQTSPDGQDVFPHTRNTK
jgi:hypothetical protein